LNLKSEVLFRKPVWEMSSIFKTRGGTRNDQSPVFRTRYPCWMLFGLYDDGHFGPSDHQFWALVQGVARWLPNGELV